MTRQNISSGSEFEAMIGYSRAVVVGEWIFVSGTTGYDYATNTISPDISTQARQALTNIEAALTSAGATLADVVRVRYILPDRAMFPQTWPVLQEFFGRVRPAATMIQAGLMREEMLVEIEVVAKKEKVVMDGGGVGGEGEEGSLGPLPLV